MTSQRIYGCLSAPASEDGRYHYVYRITNIIETKHYYGVRTSKRVPHKDLGVYYFSSSANKQFKEEQRANPHHYKYKVLAVFSTRIDAQTREDKLHQMFDVRAHAQFYNKRNAGDQYSAYGMAAFRDQSGCSYWLPIDHPKVMSGEYVSHLKGRVWVKDSDGKVMTVDQTDTRYLSGELKTMNTGTVNVKDSTGKRSKVSNTDPRYLSGELVIVHTGMGVYKDGDGVNHHLPVDHPRVLSGECVSINVGKVRTTEYRQRQSEAKKGVPLSEETKRKISETLKGRESPMKGTTRSDEFKRKISETMKGRPKSEEHKRKVEEAKRQYRESKKQQKQMELSTLVASE